MMVHRCSECGKSWDCPQSDCEYAEGFDIPLLCSRCMNKAKKPTPKFGERQQDE